MFDANRRPAPAAAPLTGDRYLRLTKPAASRIRRYRHLRQYRRLTGNQHLRRHLCFRTATCDSGNRRHHGSRLYRHLRQFLGLIGDRLLRRHQRLKTATGEMVNRRLSLKTATGDLQTGGKSHRRGTNRPVPAHAIRGMVASNTLSFFLAGRGGGAA